MSYLLGYDIGSSSIKTSLVNIESSRALDTIQSPEHEMPIHSPNPGWAEQNPEDWWYHVCLSTRKIIENNNISPDEIKGIGIAYQMHGLVLLDKNGHVLRPSIIWCDSRAVEIGRKAFEEIGEEVCLRSLLNSPGNFTASKLKWVMENEPGVYEKIHKFMLPGDYIAYRLTGEMMSTPSGLSEGIFWDYTTNELSGLILDYFGFDKDIIPSITPTISNQGILSKIAAEETGLVPGTPVTYRAGDQPNNALSLNVLNPGEIAATGGTSGVVYGISEKPSYDLKSRVNSFLHVNHQNSVPRIGVLLCINGSGIQYKWVKENIKYSNLDYVEMNNLASKVPVGSEGLHILPFGNGAERILENQNPGSHICSLDFNRHKPAHFYRASLEGIAFSFVYGMEIMKEMGMKLDVLKVGNDNLFKSDIFSLTIASLLNSSIKMISTTGAEGAAKAAGVGSEIYSSIEEATEFYNIEKIIDPERNIGLYEDAYNKWKSSFKKIINS